MIVWWRFDRIWINTYEIPFSTGGPSINFSHFDTSYRGKGFCPISIWDWWLPAFVTLLISWCFDYGLKGILKCFEHQINSWIVYVYTVCIYIYYVCILHMDTWYDVFQCGDDHHNTGVRMRFLQDECNISDLGILLVAHWLVSSWFQVTAVCVFQNVLLYIYLIGFTCRVLDITR